ncbi:threonylcarbamoyl-AMP synthase [Vibrio cholerae]|uniref:Threonylcarbamoyl-AMP synthase n=1 Tax=Vibrio cholerae TaxID=666 RepID=A0A5Q6PFM8_VIBCL|nr:threonylcarbamoyl-AMP synthase [Vibrio cholerae]EGR0510076.1 threonylcarbamoyl-AMP synthase [Vibrio cholerae]EGR4165900.1 threonylcarbamoyl-AMP synthase [Vibrio cholerae]EGR4172625.1 threonylcarbamoyl-AMP synthase [Vibrio cholerae]KAA1208527.1 threonylcarbamoyl-AMP synthase [Vibrio cholerae]
MALVENLQQAVDALRKGCVIAYPTEGVFGLGCDPDNQTAMQRLLAIKQRPVEKGVILIAASYAQLRPYVDETQLTAEQLTQVLASWPAPLTWVMPASGDTPSWIRGQFDTVAVRVSDHPVVQKLCLAFGKPLTSTSANLSGQPACVTQQEVMVQLGNQIAVVVEGKTSGRHGPSEIRDARSLQVLRQG